MQANEQTLRQAMDPSHTILLVQPDDQCNNIKVQSDSYIEESTAQLEIIQLQSTMKYDTQLEVTDNKIINNTRGFVPMHVTNGITAMSGVTSQNTREQQQQCQSSGNIRSSSWSKDNRYPAKSAFQPNYLALKNNKSSPSEGDGLEMRITRVGEVVGEDCDDDNYSYDSNFADVDVETITDKPFQSRVSDELHPLTTSNQSTSMSNTNKGNLYMKLPHQPARARKSNSSSITTQSMLFDRQTTGTGKTSSFLGRASRLTDLSGFMSSKMGEAKALMVRHSYVDTNSQVDLPQSEELATQASEADQYSSVRSGAQVALIDPHASSSTQIDCIPLNIDHLTQSSYDQAYAASLVNSSLAGFRSISFPGRDDPVDIQLSALESGAYVLGVRALVDQVYDDIGSCQDVFRLLVANSAQPIVEPSIDGESNDLTLQKIPFDLPKLQGAVNAAVQLSDKTKYDLNSLVTYLKILYDTSTQMRPSSDPVTYDKNNIKDDNYYTGNSDDSLTSVSMSVSVDERIKKLAARHVVKAVVNQPSFTMSFGPPTMSDILLDNKWKKDDEDETSCFLRMDQRRFNYETESPFSPMDT